MTIYYHGMGVLKTESEQRRFDKYHLAGKFFTKNIEEAKGYGAVVEKVDINYKNPLITKKTPTMPELERISRSFGLNKEYIAFREAGNDMINAEDWVFKQIKNRGYDALVSPNWCIPFDGSIVKRIGIIKFDYSLTHYLNDKPRYDRKKRQPQSVRRNTLVKSVRVKSL